MNHVLVDLAAWAEPAGLVSGGVVEAFVVYLPFDRRITEEVTDGGAAKSWQIAKPIRREASSGTGILVDALPADAWAAMVAESNKHG
jgi:hypothetical protein